MAEGNSKADTIPADDSADYPYFPGIFCARTLPAGSLLTYSDFVPALKAYLRSSRALVTVSEKSLAPRMLDLNVYSERSMPIV